MERAPSDTVTSGRSFPDLATLAVVLLLTGPLAAGLAGTFFPAFGYLPALGASSFSSAPFQTLFGMPGLGTSIALSLASGLIASCLSVLFVILFTAGWYGTKTFQRVSRFLSPLLSVPHAAAAIGLAFLIAPSGFLARALSPWATGWERPPDLLILNDPYGLAMTLGLVAKEVPFIFLMMLAALNRPHILNYAKAGASLGYGRMASFLSLLLPQVYPLIRLPILAVVAYSTSVVDVAVILGPTTPSPLAPRIIIWMNDPDLSLRLVASAGALLQLGISLGAIALYLMIERFLIACRSLQIFNGRRFKNDGAGRFAGLGLLVLLVTSMVMSLVLLMIWSAAKSWWFPDILPSAWDLPKLFATAREGSSALGLTLLIGVSAAVISTCLALWVLEARQARQRVRTRAFQALVFLPLLVPQVSFLFGLQVLFLSAGLSGTIVSVLLCHLIFVFPYAYLALHDPWAKLDVRYEKAAAALGATRAKILFRVRLPLLFKSILTAAAVALAVSVGQYLPTLMIGAGRVITVTTESVALASGGSRQASALYALLQLVIPLAGFLLAAALPALFYRNRTAFRTRSNL